MDLEPGQSMMVYIYFEPNGDPVVSDKKHSDDFKEYISTEDFIYFLKDRVEVYREAQRDPNCTQDLFRRWKHCIEGIESVINLIEKESK